MLDCQLIRVFSNNSSNYSKQLRSWYLDSTHLKKALNMPRHLSNERLIRIVIISNLQENHLKKKIFDFDNGFKIAENHLELEQKTDIVLSVLLPVFAILSISLKLVTYSRAKYCFTWVAFSQWYSDLNAYSKADGVQLNLQESPYSGVLFRKSEFN